MSTLEELSPRVEIYSIDEAFCDLTGVRNCRDLTDLGREIRATVLQRTHLTVGVGIAQTKTLAKLANHAAKKWQRQTGGVVDLSNLERQRKLMSALPVDEVWGLDGGSAKNWTRWGSKPFSIWRIQISGLSVNILMSCSKERCVNCAVNPVCNWKSLHRRSRKLSVPARLVNASRIIPSMRQAICSYAARAAEKLRSEHQYCRFISTFIKTSPFALNEPYYGNSASVKLLTPTQDSRDIINAATRALDAIWQAGHRYQKAGVMLGDFFSQESRSSIYSMTTHRAPGVSN